jgi:cobalt-zinc-cadmium efflux system protein
MGHGHSHGGSSVADSTGGNVPASAAHRKRLVGVLIILACIAALEITIGFTSGSLALLSDAGHVAVDVFGIAMTLAAIHAAATATRRGQRTFGLYRIEVLSTLANALLLLGVAVWVLYEAIGRFTNPPPIAATAMIFAASAGLIGNVGAFLLLRQGASEALSIRGASMEVAADTIASIGAIAAGVITATTGWRYADPIVAAGVALLIMPRAIALGRAAIRVLLEIAPRDVDLAAIHADLGTVPGVLDIHDLHVWTVTSGMECATAHLSVASAAASPDVLRAARATLAAHGIAHATVQVETTGNCGDVTW